MRIGIIGNGFVGRAVAQAYKLDHDVRVYDVVPERATHTLREVCDTEVCFVCVPTPQGDDGRCDTSIIDGVFSACSSELFYMSEEKRTELPGPLFAIKSTVPVGYTRRANDRWALTICHNPEFLTERCACLDYVTPSRHVIGYCSPDDTIQLEYLFDIRFPGVPVLECTSEESELIKYAINGFLATKVLFWNEIARLCDAIDGVEYMTICDAVALDGRIALSHMDVPGHDGKRGYGGACFPKDMAALREIIRAATCEEPKQIIGTIERNKEIRGE